MKTFFATLFAVLIAGLGIGTLFTAANFALPRHGVFYDTQFEEAIQYRVIGNKVELYVHGEWVEHWIYDVRHLRFHITQQLKSGQ